MKSSGEKRASLIAILSACTAFAVGMGLTLPLLSLLLERRGFPGTVNGLNLATAGVAAFVITPNVPRLIRLMGTAGYLSASLTLSAVALILLYETPSLWLWFPARLRAPECTEHPGSCISTRLRGRRGRGAAVKRLCAWMARPLQPGGIRSSSSSRHWR